jgi:hypothetical protein
MILNKIKVAAAIAVLSILLAIKPVHAASSCDITVVKETPRTCECLESNEYWIGVDKQTTDTCSYACSAAAGCK